MFDEDDTGDAGAPEADPASAGDAGASEAGPASAGNPGAPEAGPASAGDAGAPEADAADARHPQFGDKHLGPSADNAEGALEVERLLAIRAGLLEETEMVAASQGRQMRLLAEAAAIAEARTARLTQGNSRLREMALRSIALELGAAVRMNDRTMQTRLGEAEQLARLFPATIDALTAGRIERAHAIAILDTGVVLDDAEVRAGFEKSALEYAATETPARTRAFARRAAERVNPRTIDERYAEAFMQRSVSVTDLHDGMAELRLLAGVAEVHGIHDRLTQQAKAIEKADAAERRELTAQADAAEAAGRPLEGEPPRFDERTRAQIRADVAVDMLLTGAPAIDPVADGSPGGLGAIRGRVQLTIPVTTLTGVTTGGGELNGRAAVDSATARRLAGDAPGWDRVMTDPVRATVLEVDRYEPSAAQQRFLRAKDVHCRCPGCRRPAAECQLDHNHERQHGGRTSLTNMCGLCVRHHTLKTETGWTVEQLPGGALKWRSPLGFEYTDHPPTRVAFLPEEPPAPF